MSKKIRFILIITILVQLIYITKNKIDFEFENLISSLKKDFKGNLYLPKETTEIKKILVSKKIKSFNLSNEIKNSNYIYQRTIEFSYPIKFNSESEIFFEFISEKNNNCLIETTYKFTQISKCTLK